MGLDARGATWGRDQALPPTDEWEEVVVGMGRPFQQSGVLGGEQGRGGALAGGAPGTPGLGLGLWVGRVLGILWAEDGWGWAREAWETTEREVPIPPLHRVARTQKPLLKALSANCQV